MIIGYSTSSLLWVNRIKKGVWIFTMDLHDVDIIWLLLCVRKTTRKTPFILAFINLEKVFFFYPKKTRISRIFSLFEFSAPVRIKIITRKLSAIRISHENVWEIIVIYAFLMDFDKEEARKRKRGWILIFFFFCPWTKTKKKKMWRTSLKFSSYI